jgi:hypothetical protein
MVLRRSFQPRQNHKLLKSLNRFTGQTLRRSRPIAWSPPFWTTSRVRKNDFSAENCSAKMSSLLLWHTFSPPEPTFSASC